MTKEFIKLADKVKEKNATVRIDGINMSKDGKKVAQTIGVDGFPTIKLYVGKKTFIEFEGHDRKYEDFVAFLK